MSRQPRFEIVRTDAGWHARWRASNGRIVWVTESYTRRRAAVDAITNLRIGTRLRTTDPAARTRDVDERGQRPSRIVLKVKYANGGYVQPPSTTGTTQ